ncbi:Uncharacterised protein [Paenibacillus macerans]|uniref:Uncharacterized protein n=2 Tax=Paenibacillus macerans TaxID=44252 RepID=A0A090ZCC3_PAEMA|nr:hypothetical protein [Paenibacillus macerans]KFN08038.1 hypothetical protein DJ90_3321 [Paenibacillus macerans]MBS5912525.1 hypothetical protein [Paenibacillus macerans]SUA84912.1 Uncharacterised protein [Paenibacillus macerans]
MGRKTAPVLSEGRIGRTVEERLKNDRENGWKKDGLMEPTAKVQLKKAKTWLPEPERGVQQNIRATKGVIPSVSVHLREIGTIYVAIFSNDKEMTAF